MFKIRPEVIKPTLEAVVVPSLVKYSSEEVYLLWEGKKVFAIWLEFDNSLRWPKGVLRIPTKVLKEGKFKIKAYGFFRSVQKNIILPTTAVLNKTEIRTATISLAFDTSTLQSPRTNISSPSYQLSTPILKKEIQLIEIEPPHLDYFKN